MTDIETKRYHIRWMIRRDVLEVMRIEQLVSGLAWSEDVLLMTLRKLNCIGMIAEDHVSPDIVKGFMVYQLNKHNLKVLNFCVHPEWQRSGVGTAMMDKLKSKISALRRGIIIADAPERCLSMQLFLRSQGLRAIMAVDEVYRFRYAFNEAPQC